jgi:hypothetical protein
LNVIAFNPVICIRTVLVLKMLPRRIEFNMSRISETFAEE